MVRLVIVIVERFKNYVVVSVRSSTIVEYRLLFFSPGGVSSTYSGRASSLDASGFFFSLALGAAWGAAVADLACFSVNFLSFSAFFRSFSTVVRGSWYE